MPFPFLYAGYKLAGTNRRQEEGAMGITAIRRQVEQALQAVREASPELLEGLKVEIERNQDGKQEVGIFAVSSGWTPGIQQGMVFFGPPSPEVMEEWLELARVAGTAAIYWDQHGRVCSMMVGGLSFVLVEPEEE
jgi:hypothetical protein